MSNWKFWATLEGYCCKSDTYGAKTKGHENAGTKIANPRYSLGLDCTIWSLWVNSWGLFCTFRSIGSICKESKGQGLVLQIMKKYPLESTSFLVVARRWRARRRRRIPRLELRWKAWRRRDDDWSLIAATARSTPALRLVDDDDGVYCGGDGELVADHSRWRFRSFHAGSSNAGSCLACTERECRRSDAGWRLRVPLPARTNQEDATTIDAGWRPRVPLPARNLKKWRWSLERPTGARSCTRSEHSLS